jgi:hypothetical protein
LLLALTGKGGQVCFVSEVEKGALSDLVRSPLDDWVLSYRGGLTRGHLMCPLIHVKGHVPSGVSDLKGFVQWMAKA